MQIRNNVRERRRERIQQLLNEMQARAEAELIPVEAESPEAAEPVVAGPPNEPMIAKRPNPPSIVRQPSEPKTAQPIVAMRPGAPATVTRLDAPANEARRESDERPQADFGLADASLWSIPAEPAAPPLPTVTRTAASPSMPQDEPDPELWWREKQRRMKYDDTNHWAGVQGLTPTSRAPDRRAAPGGGGTSPWLRGMYARIAVAGVLLAGFYGWTKLELPGSAQARAWVVDTVTNDMDFGAVEAWYEDTFGGSPSFLSFTRKDVETKEVAAALDPKATVPPVRGRIAQSFAQNGTGVQIAAPGGSEVVAIYAGRVLQVHPEQENGGYTVLVEHPDRILSVYGHLAAAAVRENDWVEAGDKLGTLPKAAANGDSKLYFAVQQDGQKLNPTEVVPFD